jgi:cobalt-zinc-cadmium efflux system membrane fusion protein
MPSLARTCVRPLGALLPLLFLNACSQTKPAAASSPADAGATQASLLTVPQDQLPHLRIAPVRRTSWAVSIHTTGTVDWDNNHTTPAITQVNGPIVRVLAETGDAVKEGQPLLYVSSPDVANAIATYKKARNRQDLAERTIKRSQELFEHNAIARKDLESAQADYNDARTDLENALQALKIFGVSRQELEAAEAQGAPIAPQLAVRAPISGIVVQKLIAPGLLIQAGSTVCYLISDVSTVWVQGHIFDRDLLAVRIGDPVEETNASFPVVFRGTVAYVGAMLDPATRTTPVRIVTRNTGGLLKKDLFVDAVIHTRTRRNILAVPTSALLRNAQNEPFVYVEAEPGGFAQRLVTLGAQQDGQTEIASGLKEGEPVVSEGSVFLQFASSYGQ